ncbi:MAG TPA: hypothetical protein VGX92_18700 [Pyrinomonadaceae bacterium]|jgi:hypothetical protein|nr:hypothetical protein [Pyrinomonadaceae bacterium]
MKYLLILAVLLSCASVAAQAQGQNTQQVHITQIAIGKKADSIDKATQEIIERTVEENFSAWKLESVLETRESSSSTFIWALGEQKLVVSVSYLESQEEAAKQIRFNLATIQMPRYKPLEHVGAEAYLITAEGPIMFRKANMVVTVCGCEAPLEIVEQFAKRVADSLSAAD